MMMGSWCCAVISFVAESVCVSGSWFLGHRAQGIYTPNGSTIMQRWPCTDGPPCSDVIFLMMGALPSGGFSLWGDGSPSLPTALSLCGSHCSSWGSCQTDTSISSFLYLTCWCLRMWHVVVCSSISQHPHTLLSQGCLTTCFIWLPLTKCRWKQHYWLSIFYRKVKAVQNSPVCEVSLSLTSIFLSFVLVEHCKDVQ